MDFSKNNGQIFKSSSFHAARFISPSAFPPLCPEFAVYLFPAQLPTISPSSSSYFQPPPRLSISPGLPQGFWSHLFSTSARRAFSNLVALNCFLLHARPLTLSALPLLVLRSHSVLLPSSPPQLFLLLLLLLLLLFFFLFFLPPLPLPPHSSISFSSKPPQSGSSMPSLHHLQH